MYKYIIFLVVFLHGHALLSQGSISNPDSVKHEASFDFGAFYTPVLSQNLFGANMELKFAPVNKVLTGLSLSMAEFRPANTYGYSVGKPVMDYYEIGWINQYDIIHRNAFRLGINLNNAALIARLGDNAQRERYQTRNGVSHRPKEIATDCFYMLEPGMEMSVRIFSNQHYPDFYLTGKVRYRQVFGSSSFDQASNFSGFYIGLGLSVIGFTTENMSK